MRAHRNGRFRKSPANYERWSVEEKLKINREMRAHRNGRFLKSPANYDKWSVNEKWKIKREMRAHRNGRFLKSLARDDEWSVTSRSGKNIEKWGRTAMAAFSNLFLKRMKNDLKDTRVLWAPSSKVKTLRTRKTEAPGPTYSAAFLTRSLTTHVCGVQILEFWAQTSKQPKNKTNTNQKNQDTEVEPTRDGRNQSRVLEAKTFSFKPDQRKKRINQTNTWTNYPVE